MSSAPVERQPGQNGSGNHPALAIWARLAVQISAFSRVVAITRAEYTTWSPETRNNIIRMFVGETGHRTARFVADPAGDRVFLGAAEHLNNTEVVVLDIPNTALPVMFARAALWDLRPQRSPPDRETHPNLMRHQHELLMQRFGAPPSYGMPPMQHRPQQHPMANELDMNRPIATESVARPSFAFRSTADFTRNLRTPELRASPTGTDIQAAATPPPAHGPSQPRTPEEEVSPTRQGPSSRKRKSATKAPNSRKRATSSVTRGRPLRREGSDDEDDNEGQNNSQDDGNNNNGSNGSVNVNLARLPSLTSTTAAVVGVLARGDGQAARD